MSGQLHLFVLASPGGLGGRGTERGRDPRRLVESVVQYARKAEAAGFDGVLLADFVAGSAKPESWASTAPTQIDPVVLSGAIVEATAKIGIIVTLSTTFDHPYHIARQVLSLDHASGGRLAWNAVTSMSEGAAYTFGLDAMPTHSDRYARAAEVVEIVNSLWDSFDDDGNSVHATSRDGRFIKMNSILGLPRSLQGRPLLVQAGQSDDGIDFASRFAEAVFVGKDSFEGAKAVREALIAGSRSYGREQPPLALSSLGFIIGETEDEALEIERQVEERTSVTSRLQNIKKYFEAGTWNVGPDDLDLPLPPFPEHTELRQTGLEFYRRIAAEKRWTVRDFLHRTRGGHFFYFVGSADALVGEIERWFLLGAADGFILQPRGPRDDQVQLFLDRVLPVLQAKGLFRTEYSGSTFREHLGLERPASVHLSPVSS